MKTRFTILLLILSFAVHAQQINVVEYYFDTDPGFGNGTQIPVNAALLDSTFNFNISSLSAGVHTLVVRLKNSADKWSTVYQSNVFINNGAGGSAAVKAVEYYFDKDPGFGNGTQIPVNTASLDSTFNFNILSLPAGVHTLYVRLKNSSDYWSTVYQSSILINNGSAGNTAFTKAEYFFDTDPGFGNGTLINLTGAALDSTFKFSTAGLSQGLHTVFVRLQNNMNNWSFAYQGNFTVFSGIDSMPQIQSLSYFVDSVYGINNAVIQLNKSAAIDTALSIPIADNGKDKRVLGLRLKNQAGQTGNATLANISLCDLYKPKGGFRSVQYGTTFTLIDTSKYNTSTKVRWLADNVLFDSSYTCNYTFPKNFIGSKTITQITGTGCRVDSVSKVYSVPGIESYAPLVGSYNSDFNLSLYGGGLDSSLNIYLQKGDTIVHPYLKVPSDENRRLTAVFDFHGFAKTTGYPGLQDDYTLHVIYPNGFHYTDPLLHTVSMVKREDNTVTECYGSYSVSSSHRGGRCIFELRRVDPNFVPLETKLEPYFAADLTGPSNIRTGVWNNFTMSITNTGTVVAKGIPFFIMLPSHFDIDTAQWSGMYNPDPAMRDSISVITIIDTVENGRHLQYKLIAMIYPFLAPGETGHFPLRIRTTVDSAFHIFYTVQHRMFGSFMTDIYGPCWGAVFDFAIGFVPGVSCLYAFSNLINDQVNFGLKSQTSGLDWFSLGLSYAGTAVSCIPGGGPLKQIATAGAKEMGFTKALLGSAEEAANVADKGLNVISNANSAANSSDPCSKAKQTPKKKDGDAVAGSDPNYIIGNSDYDAVKHYINNYSPQQYTIGFENKPAATANAQHVYITDTLNNQKFVFQTLKLSQFSIADSTYPIPSFRNRVTKDVALKNRKDMKVRFVANFDTASGVLQTDFFSIDTAGHVLPLDSIDGFLPPDANGVSGTGTISYSIYAQTLNTLDTFSNKASIYFDNNAPVVTNTWLNTVDTTRPQGRIANAIAVNDSTVKLVMQNSGDIGSGVSYQTFYSKNGSDTLFREMGKAVGDTIIFKGKPNQTYQVFSKATDNVGLIQNKDSVADVTVTFSNTLPLTWLSFTGKMVAEKAQLNWTTANEINTSHFDVEKSTDGSHFTKIKTEAAKGNTGHNNDYISFDEHLSIGENYYRLKQFDLDGRYSYSSIVRIDYNQKGWVIISPNPAKEYVTITGSKKFEQIQLMDASGKVIKTFIQNNNNVYSLSGISKGIYLIRLATSNEIQTHKLIVL